MATGPAPREPDDRRNQGSDAPSEQARTSNSFAVTATLLVLAIIAVFVVIGFLAAPRGQAFNWDSASLAATALATVSLAAYTARLARSTARDVEATGSLARLAAKDQELRDRATLVVTDVGYVPAVGASGAATTVAAITLLNIGLAPAAFISLDIVGSSNSGERIFHGLSDNGNFLRAGEELTVHIALTHDPDSPQLAETKVSGVYLQRNHLQRDRPHVDQNAEHFEWKLEELTRQTWIKYPNNDANPSHSTD
jgi:hypothetical protein